LSGLSSGESAERDDGDRGWSCEESATVRCVQDVGAALAADPVDRRHPCVALNLDLDIEKERRFAASSLHRELRAADAALTGMASELPSLAATSMTP
jgi:hypothetical protein